LPLKTAELTVKLCTLNPYLAYSIMCVILFL
jgi:hypothetical protein